MKGSKNSWLFVTLCLLLAILADICLLEQKIGISYSVFIGTFYVLFFYKFRKIFFTHKQISFLLFASIWTLTISYFIYSNPIFYTLNLLAIPLLVLVHTVLLTSPTFVQWHSFSFISLVFKKIKESFRFGKLSIIVARRKVKRSVNDSTYQTGKKIGLGILLAIPLLVIVIPLLTSADEKFAKLLFAIPQELLNFQADYIWRIVKIGVIMAGLVCYLNVLPKKAVVRIVEPKAAKFNWDAIIITTMLVFINIVYALFTVVQFQYFFSSSLQEGFSYSEYARRGFLELIAVTIVNYGVLISTVAFVKKASKVMSNVIKVLLTLLISFSSIMLISAFLRLMMYEQAYGFTYLRIFAHSFMIFLFIIFIFTLMKVWVRRLSIARFYIICSLLYYVGLNIVGIENIIVANNIERYENTGKIDISYLGMLSYSAIPDLVELYEANPSIPGLKDVLVEKQQLVLEEQQAWQSFNLPREKAKKALARLKVIN